VISAVLPAKSVAAAVSSTVDGGAGRQKVTRNPFRWMLPDFCL
jgi:hypothetical protein